MSDSTAILAQLLAQTSGNEERVNELVAAASPATVYGRNVQTTAFPVWGFYGGRYGGTSVANGTVTLTDSATNYIVAHRTTRAVSASTATTNWNDAGTYLRLYLVVCGASSFTSWEDHRAGPRGSQGPLAGPQAEAVASAATIAIGIGQRVVSISGTTGITSITATGHNGALVVLIFLAALTVTDGSNLKLNGSFTTTADDTLTLACDGTNWYEVARSAN